MPRFMVDLPVEAVRCLQDLAQTQHRTPKGQAEWLLLEALGGWAHGDSPSPRGTLGVGKGSAYPERLPEEGSLTQEFPPMFTALGRALTHE